VSTPTTTMVDSQNSAPGAAPTAYPPLRLMLWSVRRELWENRSVYIAPLAAAGLMILAILIPVLTFAGKHAGQAQSFGVMTDTKEIIPLWIPYMLVAAPVFGIGAFVAIAYSLSALHGERRDRSILFWKSLPVSDLMTVLSKAAIPIILMPLISFVAAVVAQLVIFAIALAAGEVLGANAHFVWAGVPMDGRDAVHLIWAGTPIGYLTLATLYGVVATALWHAPIYAWLLLVGGWARRMSFVWAVAPVIGLVIAERIVFGTDRLATMFSDRLDGSLHLAFAGGTDSALPMLTPVRFVCDPGLWLGLGVAAVFLAAAVLLRRHRQPI
jgi:ABC-2 type transport system permease protein